MSGLLILAGAVVVGPLLLRVLIELLESHWKGRPFEAALKADRCAQ